MDKDKVVTEDNYKQVVLKRMITLCWVLLGICFVIKIFGGNFFAFVGESNFIKWLSESKILLGAVQFLLYCIGTMLYFLTLFKNKHILYCVLCTIITGVLKQFVDVADIFIYLSFVVEAIFVFLIPAIIKRKQWYNVIIMGILLLVFQAVSMFIKNIGITQFPYDDTVGFIFLIDYYIMLTLVYLYSIKGDIDFMKLGLFFLSKDATQLEAYKQVLTDNHNKKVAKLNVKHDNKVAKVDARIEKINKKK